MCMPILIKLCNIVIFLEEIDLNEIVIYYIRLSQIHAIFQI